MQSSQISQLIQSLRTSKSSSSPFTVQKGQILPGRVVKFFPQNRALVQMRGTQVMAQLDASLEANQRYLMQVTETSPAIKMKVLSDQPANQPNERLQVLMQALGLKLSKADQQVLQQLMRLQVPLSKETLGQLFGLGKNDSLGMRASVLAEMIQRNLPLTEQVYQSVAHRFSQSTSFSNAIQHLVSLMMNEQQPTVKQVQLASNLQLLQGARSSEQVLHSFIFQAIKEVGNGSQTTFQLAQKAGIIPQQTSFAEWTSQWRAWANSQSVSFQPSTERIVQGNLNISSIPFSITGEKIIEQIQKLWHFQLGNQTKGLQLVHQALQQALAGSTQGANHHVLQNVLQGERAGQIQAKLTPQQQQAFQQLIQVVNERPAELPAFLQSSNGKTVMNALQSLLAMQTGGEEARALRFWSGMAQTSNTPGELFTRVMSFVEMTQVDGKKPSNDYPSILTLLKQVQNQSTSHSIQSASQQVQQVLQAMHLSVDTARDVIQFSMQMPKEMFGLNEDLWMDFEGKKQEDGSIHPEQCRILFYLNLPALNDVVLDMQVLNRSVDLTIFHQEPESIRSIVKSLESELQAGLTEVDYIFHSLQLKEIGKQQVTKTVEARPGNPLNHGGIDFKA